LKNTAPEPLLRSWMEADLCHRGFAGLFLSGIKISSTALQYTTVVGL